MWFKNLIIYRITKPVDWELDKLQQTLKQQAFIPCDKLDLSKFGWTSPVSGSELYYHAANGQILLKTQKEEKILPANVIKEALEKRVNKREQEEHRPLKKAEKQALKEEITFELLPRAFSKHQFTLLWIDTQNQLIYIDAASFKKAEEILGLLRKTLGSLPVVPLSFNLLPTQAMTNWITEDKLPQWLEILEEAEIKSFDDDSSIRCKQQDLYSEEILKLLENNRLITQLGVIWEERLSCIIQEDGRLKRIKFSSFLKEQNETIDKADIAQKMDADFILMVETIKEFIDSLIIEFNGIAEFTESI